MKFKIGPLAVEKAKNPEVITQEIATFVTSIWEEAKEQCEIDNYVFDLFSDYLFFNRLIGVTKGNMEKLLELLGNSENSEKKVEKVEKLLEIWGKNVEKLLEILENSGKKEKQQQLLKSDANNLKTLTNKRIQFVLKELFTDLE